MRRQDFATTCMVLLMCSTGSLFAQERIWRPYTELETRGSSIRWAGQGNLFLPLLQDGDSMLFADLRGHWTDAQAAEGNWGLAFRQMLLNGWILGVHGAFDLRHSELGNNFQQATVGTELLNENWGLRWNGYFPGEGPELIPTLNAATLSGNNILIRQAAERAYSGTDFELEHLLWSNEPVNVFPWMAFQNFELWGSAGVFHFDNDAQGFEDLTGPRARLEMRFYDIPIAGPDSRLVLSGQFEHDDVRGSVGTGMLTVRIPFGRGGSWSHGLLTGLSRRMVAPIVRDVDIITNVGFDAPEPAKFAHTGQAISQVVTIDANTVNPETVIAGAGNNSLVIVDGNAGTILPNSTINTLQGQVLMGGGSNLVVTGVSSGASVNFNAPGSRPLIDSIANTNINAGNGSSIFAMDLANSGNGVSGVLLNDNLGVLIHQVGINVTGLSASGIQSNGDSRFTLNNSSIRTSGQFGDGIQTFGNSQATVVDSSISTSGQDAEGIQAAGNSELFVENSSIFTSGLGGSEGILALDNTLLGVSNSTVTVTGPSTIGMLATPTSASDNLTAFIDGTTINGTSHGVFLDGVTFGTGTLNAAIAGNTITVITGANEVNVETGGAATINLSATNNLLDPLVGTINLNELSGTINVTQGAPFTDSNGLDAVNGIPATNVLIPGNAIDFDVPFPPVP